MPTIIEKKYFTSWISVWISEEWFKKFTFENERLYKCLYIDKQWSGEVTLTVFVDFLKAFDTIDFNILIQKLHKLHFSKTFLYLKLDYLSNQTTRFVQIESSFFLFRT